VPPPKGHPPYRNAAGELPGGRPEEWTEARIDAEADALLEWVENSKEWWFLDYCVKRKIHASILARLAKKNDRFRRVYLLARQKQESLVSYGCITKKLDGNFGWRFLSSHYRWQEDQDKSGLDEESETPGSRALADTKKVCIEHADSIEQAGG